MELKVNVDTKALATQLLKDMCLNMHGNVVAFTQQKFSPSGWNPMQPFPFAGPGMGSPFPYSQGHAPYGYNPNFGQAGGEPQQQPWPGPQFQPFARPATYYSPEKFKDYAAMMDKLSTDEALVKKLEDIVAAHLQEFLQLTPDAINRPNQY